VTTAGIAQQIVEAHGGHLSLKSELGQGSLFQIELPLNQSTVINIQTKNLLNGGFKIRH
jgi:K+-sensing histidine kinase KdpD